jgi:hypothetical protein
VALSSSPVNVPAVPDVHDQHQQLLIVNGVENPIVSDANSVSIFTFQFYGADWAWIFTKQLEANSNAGSQ